MVNEKDVAEQYLHGDLLNSIQVSIAKLGKTPDSITIEDLAPVDEFHIGGRMATANLIEQLDITEQGHILDVGCGLGGAARFVADKYNIQVTGIDLVHEYIETGKVLCTWVNLNNRITLEHGSALSMPFQDDSFDGGFMLHVGMNIEDKAQLFTEIYRVLRSGSSFGVYDIMRYKDGELTYPVPWATDNLTSKLATPDQYKEVILRAGFEVTGESNRRDVAIKFFEELRAKTEAKSGPPALGLHILMKESTTIKINNMIDNIARDYIAPVEIIAHKN